MVEVHLLIPKNNKFHVLKWPLPLKMLQHDLKHCNSDIFLNLTNQSQLLVSLAKPDLLVLLLPTQRISQSRQGILIPRKLTVDITSIDDSLIRCILSIKKQSPKFIIKLRLQRPIDRIELGNNLPLNYTRLPNTKINSSSFPHPSLPKFKIKQI